MEAQTLLRREKFRIDNWHLSLWRGARSSSPKRKLSFSITPQQIREMWDRQGGRCYWSGVEMLLDIEPGHLLRVSLDRVDPSLGYEEGNVVLTCLFINIGRRNRSPSETLDALEMISAARTIKLAAAMA
jgi:hypothetical protein